MSKDFFRIVHFSDLHVYGGLPPVSGFFDKRIIGVLNSRLFRRNKYREERIPEAVRMMLRENADLFVFTGDAATCSQKSEFEKTLSLLSPLIRSKIPILFVPGNHDLYVKDPECRKALEEFISSLTNGLLTLNDYPFVTDLGKLRFLLFNASRPTNPVLSCGRFDEKSVSLLKKETENKAKDLVALCHFPMTGKEVFYQEFRRGLHGKKLIREELKKIDLILCGHKHKPYRMTDGTGRGEADPGSLTRYGIYSVIDFDGKNFIHQTRKLSI